MILRNSCYLPNKTPEASQSMSGHRNIKRRCGESHLESPTGCGHGPATGCVFSKLVQLPTPPLSKHQLKRLEEHKYQSAGRSLLEPLMQGYWEWLVGRVPAWIAPNLITIIGLLINIFTTLLLVYYCPTATEQTYVSGTLRFGIIDVTEVQIFIIIMHLLAVIGGPPFWQSLIPILNIQVKIFPALCTVAGTIFSCTNYFGVIFTGGVGKNGSTIAGTSVLSPFLHIGSVIALAAMIYKKSAVQLFERHPCLYILTFGFVSAKITNKLVVAHMTKSEMHLHDTAFIGPALLFLDQYFNSFIDEYVVLWIALIFSLFDLLRYCVSVCNQIAAHLHIHVFRIKSSSTHSNHH
ncbi:choline/ethanolaminephosphotransferase 1 isoform X3 [Apus apus]|uniref:choline/ethanolaminephosphotransferase 1 isoform X3 n=1 Tax=Apus apus TaxID=8895 RepID=UPI0021F8EF9F|nr:choline/ethanolaminephosphotransferase 1 isoform X3 [Apus apus]